jgi:hypothetical protein
MSNHFHMIASTPESNLDAAMNYFLREVSRAVNLETGRKNHVFGGPYKWSLIDTPTYYGHALQYAYMNPVRAGLCTWPEEYNFSTMAAVLGSTPLLFPLARAQHEFQTGIPSEPEEYRLLLKQRIHTQQETALIRSALRKPVFKYSRQKARQLGIKIDKL